MLTQLLDTVFGGPGKNLHLEACGVCGRANIQRLHGYQDRASRLMDGCGSEQAAGGDLQICSDIIRLKQIRV